MARKNDTGSTAAPDKAAAHLDGAARPDRQARPADPRAAQQAGRDRRADRQGESGAGRRGLLRGPRRGGARERPRGEQGAARRRDDQGDLPRTHQRVAGAPEGSRRSPTSGRSTATATSPRSSGSARRRVQPLGEHRGGVRGGRSAGTPISASCRWRTRPTAASPTRSTCSSGCPAAEDLRRDPAAGPPPPAGQLRAVGGAPGLQQGAGAVAVPQLAVARTCRRRRCTRCRAPRTRPGWCRPSRTSRPSPAGRRRCATGSASCRQNIEDSPYNETRFAVIGADRLGPDRQRQDGADVPDQPHARGAGRRAERRSRRTRST